MISVTGFISLLGGASRLIPPPPRITCVSASPNATISERANDGTNKRVRIDHPPKNQIALIKARLSKARGCSAQHSSSPLAEKPASSVLKECSSFPSGVQSLQENHNEALLFAYRRSVCNFLRVRRRRRHRQPTAASASTRASELFDDLRRASSTVHRDSRRAPVLFSIPA